MFVDAASVTVPNDGIAIIGMAVALRGAQSLERFWCDARNGVQAEGSALPPLSSEAAFLRTLSGVRDVLRDAGYLQRASARGRAMLVLALPGASAGGGRAAFSAQVAELFELDGACTVDAAGLSTFSALGLACEELRAGRADLIVAGGYEGPPLLPGEAVIPSDFAWCALKRETDAIADRDRVYALIRDIGPGAECDPKAGPAPSLGPLIECALALQHCVVPPNAHLCEASGRLLLGAPSSLHEGSARPWISGPDGAPRSGVVTASNGMRATFCVVLEEPRGNRTMIAAGASAPRVFFWSAPNPRALSRAIAEERGRFDAPPREVHALPAHPRLGFAARSSEEYQQLLALAEAELGARSECEGFNHPRGIFYRRQGSAPGAKVAALFAGQGSQYVDMGRDAALCFPPIRRVFDDMNAHFAGVVPLSEVVFTRRAGASREVLEQQLRRTEYAQPAVGALSWGQYELVREMGFEPDAVIGHSFGELTALCAAGCLSPAGFMTLARARGLAMAPPADCVSWDSGAMAAISASEHDVAPLLRVYSDVRICNYNAPTQVVVGGPVAAIEAFVVACDDIGLKAQLLPVAAAFHSPLVSHALESFRRTLDATEFRPPKRVVLSNNGARAYGGDAEQDRALLTGQLTQPVRFETEVLSLYQAGHRVFVEFGPKNILTKLVQAILTDTAVECVSFDGGPRKSSELAIQQACVQLKVLGLPLVGLNRWSSWHEPSGLPQMESSDASVQRRAVQNTPATRPNLAHPIEFATLPADGRSQGRPRTDGAGLRGLPSEWPSGMSATEKVAVS